MIPRSHRLGLMAMVLVLGGSLFALHAQDAPPKPLEVLLQTLAKIENPVAQASILRGLNTTLKGQRDVPVPATWEALYSKLKASPSEEVRRQAQALAVTFGGGAALAEMRRTLGDAAASMDARQAALDSLLAIKDAAALPLLLDLLKQPSPLRGPAVRGLAAYDDVRIPAALLAAFPALDSAEKRDVLGTLLARPASARALLAAIDAKQVAKSEITAPLARQLQNIKDPEIEVWMKKNWGSVRATSADKQKEIARYKKFATPDLITQADAERGRALFNQTCTACHAMFGAGGKIGPELPGSFEDVDYLLQNILDPNALVGKDYQQTFITTKGGQLVSGIVTAEDEKAVVLKTLGDPVTVARADIAEMQVSEQSMMPEGLLAALDEQGVRDLFLYLRQRAQVPLLATNVNAGDFFNGIDLTRWRTAGGAWKVENGGIVGRGAESGTAALVSEMVATDFRFKALIKVDGELAVAEIAFRGQPWKPKSAGTSLSLGGRSAVNLWHYEGGSKPVSVRGNATVPPGEWVSCEIVSKGGAFTVSLDGKTPFQFTGAPLTGRHGFAFYVRGKDAALHVKNVKLEVD